MEDFRAGCNDFLPALFFIIQTMTADFDRIIDRKGTSSVKYDMRGEIFGNRDVVPMWVADMDFPVPEAVSEALKERASHPIYGYSVVSDSYFEAFIGWQKRRHDWEISKESVLFSPGIVTGVNLLVRSLTRPGDRIIVQPPVYFPFFSAVEKNDRKLLYNQLIEKDGNYSMDFDDLETKLKKGAKMLILCSPHNPVGRSWTLDELRTAGELCVKYGAVIISDEIHCDLVFKPYRHIPMAKISGGIEQQTVTCLSTSKTFNLAGLFTSQIIIQNEEHRKAYQEEMDKVHLSPNIFGMVASEAAYRYGDAWLDELLDYLWNNYLLVKDFLGERLPRIGLTASEATYLLWLDFRDYGLSEKDLNSLLTEKAGIGMNMGSMFGPGGKGFQRMNIACPRPVVEKALESLVKVFEF